MSDNDRPEHALEDLSKTCFVAMPIKESGSPEHAHFAGIYELIREVLRRRGYKVERADRNIKPGNINRDIITKLATTALVVVDLSDLNPNVFYELGVRHALRRTGTILLIDKEKSPTIPFDLASYRVIQYKGDIGGVPRLLADLEATIEGLITDAGGESISASDSPVHDWFPQLPGNVIEASSASIPASTAEEIAELRRQVESYKASQRRGESDGARQSDGSTVIQGLRQALTSGAVASSYGKQGEEAVERGDAEAFLDAAERLLNAKDDPKPILFLRFAAWAKAIGFPALQLTILDEALARYPGNQSLVRDVYLRFAQTDEGGARQRAKAWFADHAGIDLESGEITGQSPIKYTTEIGHVLEILHSEGNDELGLKILEAVERSSGVTSHSTRDRARQYAWLDRVPEAIEAYRTVALSSFDDNAIAWFGNVFHNNGYFIESAEIYCLQAFCDLNEPDGFLNVADSLSLHLWDYYAMKDPDLLKDRPAREIPNSVGIAEVQDAIRAGLSCGSAVTINSRDVLDRVLRRTELDPRQVAQMASMSWAERLDWLSKMYGLLRSDLTADFELAKRLFNVPQP